MSALVPSDKFDTSRAQAAVDAGYPAIAPVLPSLLEWLQDVNWPVARILAPFLAGIGGPLETNLREILAGTDLTWRYSVIQGVISKSPELRRIFWSELNRLATTPTDAERSEQLDEIARDALHAARST
jgi:hypothetical protein